MIHHHCMGQVERTAQQLQNFVQHAGGVRTCCAAGPIWYLEQLTAAHQGSTPQQAAEIGSRCSTLAEAAARALLPVTHSSASTPLAHAS